MKKNVFTLIVLVSLLSAIGGGKLKAQSTVGTDFWVKPKTDVPYYYIDNSIVFNINSISKFEERIYFIKHLYDNENFLVTLGEKDGEFVISHSDERKSNLKTSFESFYRQINDDFNELSKDDAGYYFQKYKSDLNTDILNHAMMDIYTRNGENSFCSTALPFCTDAGTYNFPAGVDAGEGEVGPDYNCLSSTPNPAWYYLKIDDPGNIDIYMYSTPLVDIDFCCWGPFSDPITPCPNGLTSDKAVSCSYSLDPQETCKIPSSAQTGEYYILIITNYSNQPCNINFSKQNGTGTTDCSIMAPLINSNSPLCIGEDLLFEAEEVPNAMYKWTGPNGWSSNLRNPSITNVTTDMAGTYSCSIIIDDEESDIISTEVEIFHNVYADYNNTNACENYPTTFTCTSTTDPGGQIISRLWDFGDGTTDTCAITSHTYTNDGIYEVTLTISSGGDCNDIITKNLTVHPSYDTLIIDTICQWDSYIQNGFVLDSMPAGLYQDTLFLNSINGCDSIVKLNLIVGQLYDTTIVDYICEGDSYNLNNFLFVSPQVGTHFDTLFLNSIYGCDSIVKLNLTVNPIYDTIISAAICEGGSYTENGFVFENMSAGSYNDVLSLSTIYGCDSIVRLDLTVHPSYDITLSESICEGESYTENGFSFINKPAGSYNDIQLLSTIYGCDSIVRIELTVHPNYDTTISESICEGESYTENGFSFINKPAGSYQDYLLLSSVHGCDSTVRIHLTVNKTYSYDIYDSICEGEDYHMYGLDLINPNAGLYEHVSNLHTVNGCDSIYNVTLKVINKYDDVVIEGLENISVATNLATGCYRYTIGKADKNDHYTWEIDNDDWEIIPDNNECIVCATTPDRGTLYVRAENSCGAVYDYIVLNAEFIENQGTSRVVMYPNPVTDFINIQQSDISRINVYDSYGQLVMRNDYNFDSHITLDLSRLKNSIYIIEIITLEQTFVERINIAR